MTIETFLDWERGQSVRHEFVDGVPSMMSGGTQAHDRICINMLVALRNRLKGSRCSPGTSDMKVLIPNGNVRYPDVSMDCGPFRATQTHASELVVVIEVLSKSTAWVEQHHKLDDYRSLPSMRQIVFLSQDEAHASIWTRDADGWRHTVVRGLDGHLAIAEVAGPIPMTEIYDGVPVEPSAAG